MTFARARLAILALVLISLGAGGYLLLRDSSLVRVHDVEVSGVHGRYAAAIRRTLEQAGKRMTTLNVREDELEKAVASFRVVRSLSASADFPNGLRIRVNEFVPVSVLVTPARRRVAVSGEGRLLPQLGHKKLPVIRVKTIPGSGRLEDSGVRRLVEVLSGAPPALRSLLARAYVGPGGIRVALRKGTVIYFGASRRLAAKWASAGRVLAQTSSRGARYIDVRVPERPAAGGAQRATASVTNPQL